MAAATERVLVCILGETRAHALTWENFERNVLVELSADLAICIGLPKQYDTANPFYQSAKYRWTIPEFDDWGDAFDLAARASNLPPDWRRLLRIRHQWLGGIKGPGAHPGSAGILLFFRWLLLQKLRENDLLSQYDRFIVTRSDFYYWCPHPPLQILDPRYVWIPRGEDYGGFTDRHVVASAHDIVACLDVMDDVLRRPQELYREMHHFSRWNLEQYLRFQFRKKQIEGRVRRYPYVMTTVRGPADSSRWAKGAFDPSVGMIIKYQSEKRLADEFHGKILSKHDWLQQYSAPRLDTLVSPPDGFSQASPPLRPVARCLLLLDRTPWLGSALRLLRAAYRLLRSRAS
jgi:hypothetical protein